MRPEIHTAIISVVVIAASSASGVFAQQPPGKCDQVRYSERLTGEHRYRLKSIEGQVVYGEVAERGEFQPASGVCVNLFNRTTKRPSASVATNSDGQFQFTFLGPGKYLLMVSLSALHEIVIPVEVDGRPRAKAFKPWGLLLHLRSKDDRKKSFVTPITQLGLREELLKMVRKDQAVRNEMIKNGSDRPDQALEKRMAVIDAHGTARIKEIVKRYGWPGPELVGRDGADAAFLIVQHSPDLAFQQAMLPLVRRSYEKGKLTSWNYALLQDRVLVRGGKPQLYGMSVNHWERKEPVLDPIQDEVNVDKRRARIGLPPLREYLEFMKRLYFPNQ